MPPDWKPWEPYNWNWKQFAEDPTKYINPWKDPSMTPPWGLITESGLIEIYSASTERICSWGQSGYYLNEDLTPDTQKYEQDNSKNPIPDPLAPVIPKARPNPEKEKMKTYPIAIETCHPKFYYHTTYQDVLWLQDEEKKEVNGHLYAPIWMNKKDADDRGIKYGDIVRVFNMRGQILCWARTSEQMMPGAGRVTYGYWNDYDEPGVPGSLDRSGNIENLCRGGFVSPFDTQTDVQAIAQIEKWSGSL
jgi:anaerobic selenocysteine-containing dehydrogenase